MDSIAEYATWHPDRAALIEGDRVMSWAGLVQQRNRLAHALLALGLAPGEHMAVYVRNTIEHLLIGAAVRAIGGIALAVNQRLVASPLGRPPRPHLAAGEGDEVLLVGVKELLPVVAGLHGCPAGPG